MSVNSWVCRVIIIALAFVLVSCSQPKYLVKGLTLPPGSTEVSYDKDIDAVNKLPFPVPGAGKIIHNATVNFDCSSNWSSVSAHFDSRMNQAGYASSAKMLDNMPGGGDYSKMMDENNKMMRMYQKVGGRFIVMVMNNNWMADSVGMPGIDLGMADYTLTVIEFEGDK